MPYAVPLLRGNRISGTRLSKKTRHSEYDLASDYHQLADLDVPRMAACHVLAHVMWAVLT